MLFLAGHLQALRDAGAAELAEVTVNYRDSALSVHDGAHHRGMARAGEHAPDPAGIAPAVEDLLTVPGFLLLTRSADHLDELRGVLGDLGTVVQVVREGVGRDRVVDPADAIARAYGLRPDGLALIRPDGYLGLVADTADTALLRRYLADVLRVTEPALT
jgi:hypothetical protein